MEKYIESVLHQKIELIPCEGLEGLPLYLNGNYNFYRMLITGQQCILAVPKEQARLSEFRKHQKRIEQITGQYCVLYLKNMNYYSRDKMLEEGIPFIWENKQIYMPFLGILLKKNDARKLPDCSEISFLTQKFLLTALYEKWNNMNVTMAAEHMCVSKMSITRVFDEIESMQIPILDKNGRSRRYIQYGTKKDIWKVIEPFMRSPLLKEYYLEKSVDENLMKSGISGLSEMSMLEDNGYQTYAVTKYEIREKRIAWKKQVPKEEVPGCIIQELGYCIPFKNGKVIDPLSIYLLLKNETEEPRIEIAIDEMLEEYVW